MHLIKSNPFVSTLVGITLVLCAGLYYMGSKGAQKYQEAKDEFDNAYQAVTKAESIPLYPTAPNRDAKTKALADYRQAIQDFQGLYGKYLKQETKPISTQEFTERLKAAKDEVTKALTDAGCALPLDFFMGFEDYQDRLALTEATGILDYQVQGMKHVLLDLAEARPTELIKIYREKLPEETRGKLNIQPNQVARQFGFEISFKGSESSARDFLTSLGDIEPYYYTIRCVKLENERDTPPKVSDAKFEKPKVKEEEVDTPFGADFFGFDNEEADPEPAPDGEEPDAEEEPKPEDPPAEEAEPVDSSRILAQVLGGEEVLVFVRFDLNLFLPVKELPKP
ncbi:MAG: Amuc_1100 family pilus-like protein [Akkermansiaceae bacterium]